MVSASGFFALRTPLLPLDELHGFSRDLRAPQADGEPARAEALAHDRRLLRERLSALVARPEVREALFVASPSLDESLPAWLKQPGSERARKVERALVRYFARMCARPTPFGLFAGFTVGTLGERTRLELGPRASYRRHTRLDGDYLSKVCEALGRDRAVRRTLVFRPNSSLYRAAGRLRYAEARLAGTLRAHHLVAVEPSEPLELMLSRARAGARLDELTAALVDDQIGADEAEAFVHELIDAQLLVSELAPQVTGGEPVHDLIAQLRRHEETAAAAGCLEAARSGLEALDQTSVGTPPAAYQAIADGLRALPVELEPPHLFQVDLVKPAAASLGAAPVDELLRVVALLHRISPVRDGLKPFRDAFVRRYGEREVPLAEVLDEESGIGFDPRGHGDADASPLLEGLRFGGARSDEPRADRYFELLLRRLGEALTSGANEIVLDEKELEAAAGPDPAALPDSLAAIATLVAPSAEAADAGEFLLYLDSVSGPSGANLLGRFCHGDEVLTGHVRRHLRLEEARRPDAIFAEIVHLPEGRVGNLVLRPLLREHELVYLGRSGAPEERQLRLDELTVAVTGGRVVLRSRRLGKEIVPRLTTAHAFTSPRNLGVYRFLCALAAQGLSTLRFDWGVLARAPRLPRLRIGRTVLSPARWRLSPAQLEPLGKLDDDARFVAVQALRHALRLPRWVLVGDGDQLLPVDLDNVLLVDTFVQLVKGRREVVLTELPGADCQLARGPEGGFSHELIMPMISTVSRPQPVTASTVERAPRGFLPGSEWLYAKLYTGSATADELLRRVVAPLVTAARSSGAVDAWFFIRYGDPDWHLRVRLHGDPSRLLAEVLPALHAAAAPALAAGQLWKLQLDTYERELERYGGEPGIALAEALFCADSDAVLGIVETLVGDDAADARWRIALRGMDQLLDDLGFELPRKRALVARCRDGLAHELEGGATLAREVGDKFRKERSALEALLDRAHDHDGDFGPALERFAIRSERVRALAAGLREHAAAGRLTASLDDLASSFMHMHCNRMLRGAARAQERVLYDFLTRLYEGQIARRRTLE
jgi:thiopeptide-type bacteriocin biosynthesis protein